MPQHLDPNFKPTETQPCSICHQPRRCRRVRKPKLEDGKLIYPYVWLCELCVRKEIIA